MNKTALKWLQTAHVVVSMIMALTLLFFASSGFMMNHRAWFEPPGETTSVEHHTLDASWPQVFEPRQVEEVARVTHGVRGTLASYEEDADGVRMVFRRPGERVDVVAVPRPGGPVVIEREDFGWAGWLEDLHRNRGSGAAWPWVVDTAAISLMVVAATGMVLGVLNPWTRRMGVWALALGIALTATLVLLAIP